MRNGAEGVVFAEHRCFDRKNSHRISNTSSTDCIYGFARRSWPLNSFFRSFESLWRQFMIDLGM
jgi:hypothetical protein